MNNKSVIFLRVSAAILITYAFAFLAVPDLLGKLVGFTHHSPNTLVEVTAFYGGLELGMAIFFLWSAKTKRRSRHALMMVFLVFLYAGLARFFGIARFGFEGPSQPVVAALEIGWSLIAYWMANKMKQRV